MNIEKAILNLIETWGIPGLFLVILAGVIVYLWREIKAERKLNAELQQKRFEDMQFYTSAIEKFRETNEQIVANFEGALNMLKGSR